MGEYRVCREIRYPQRLRLGGDHDRRVHDLARRMGVDFASPNHRRNSLIALRTQVRGCSWFSTRSRGCRGRLTPTQALVGRSRWPSIARTGLISHTSGAKEIRLFGGSRWNPDDQTWQLEATTLDRQTYIKDICLALNRDHGLWPGSALRSGSTGNCKAVVGSRSERCAGGWLTVVGWRNGRNPT